MRERSVRFDLDNATSDSDRGTLSKTLVIYPKSICLSPTPLITMPPRGGNAKKESGRAKKAENEAKKKDAVAAEKVCATFPGDRTSSIKRKYLQERQEGSKWDQGAKKDKGVDKEAKRLEQLARKAETARLLAEEEATASSKKTSPNKGGNKKKDTKPAGPGALSAGDVLDTVSPKETSEEAPEVESFSATGIDNALDLLEVVNAKTDKASVGQQAAGIERHPEVSVDVDVYTQLADNYPCLLILIAKVQGKSPLGYPGGPPRLCIRSCVLVHRLGRLGGVQGTGVT